MARIINILLSNQNCSLIIFCCFYFNAFLFSDDNFKNGNILLDNEISLEKVYSLEDYTVVAERFGQVRDFSLASIQVLGEKEFKKQVQSTIGQSLAWEPGISSSYFGPGSSRPVIRGLGDFRVRMLLDDIGTFDVSENSPDHGIPIEPLLIHRIDIHRGPDALLFGNAAIGGVVNMQSYYIPEDFPNDTVSGSIELKANDASNGNSGASYIAACIDDFAWCLTHSFRSADEYSIPGRARTDQYDRIADPVVNNPTIGLTEPIPNPIGLLPNTFIDTNTHSLGVLWSPKKEENKFGLAYSNFESAFGVPYQYGGDANELFGYSQLDMVQSRVDVEAEFKSDLNHFKKTKIRIGTGDYRHEEKFFGDGKDQGISYVDTIMDLDSIESRFDFYHKFSENLQGISGIHIFSNELQASRIPDLYNPIRVYNAFTTDSYNFFIMETYTYQNLTLKGGYRFCRQKTQDTSIASYVRENTQTSNSAAIGVTWRDYKILGLDEFAVSLNLSRIERIPSETERYAYWSNAAINRFVIGLDNAGEQVDTESSKSIEIGVEGHIGKCSSRLNLYEYDFSNFIFLQDIKGIGNLSRYVAKDSNLKGGEAKITFLLKEEGFKKFLLNGFFDFVTGKNITDDTFLPRIPPKRIGLGFDFIADKLEANVELRYAFAQKNIQAESNLAKPELETEHYYELDLYTQYTFKYKDSELVTFARLENAFNAERRMHTSFLKDVAPLPGRNFSLGMRWVF